MNAVVFPVVWLVPPLMLAVMLYDLRFMRIPSRLVGLILLIFVASVPLAAGWADLSMRLVAGLLVLSGGILGFALRLWGGGDVKALSALVLLVPPAQWTEFSLVFSAALLAGIVLVLALRRLWRGAGSSWAFLRDGRRFPMGVSIGLAGLAMPLLA